MLTQEEFCQQVGIEQRTLLVWIDEGWLVPQREIAGLVLSEMDAARARLIRDLRENVGVNDEGIGVILSLVDQVHGLRSALWVLLEHHKMAARDIAASLEEQHTR
jgi:chaperone modulatory protein CbpM